MSVCSDPYYCVSSLDLPHSAWHVTSVKAQWITTLKVNCACGGAGNIAIAGSSNIVDL